MNLSQHCSTSLCLALLLTGSAAQAMDYGVVSVGVQASGNNGVQQERYNPWRPQPKQWGFNNDRQQLQTRPMVQPQPVYVYPVHPIHSRQVEYRGYLQQFGAYYGNQGGLPWWADQSAVPYGPWAAGNGWPNGIW